MVVYWKEVCGDNNETGLGELWDHESSWNITNPDVPWCCQVSIFAWCPLILFTFFTLFYIIYLVLSPTVFSFKQKTKLNIFKLLLTIVLVIIAIVDIVKAGVDDSNGIYVPPAYYITPAVQIAGYLWATFILHYEFSKGVVSSGFFFLLWLTSLVLGIIRFRSIIIRADAAGGIEDVFRAVTFYIAFGVIVIQFIVTLFPDVKKQERIVESVTEETENLFTVKASEKKQCPEETTSFVLKTTHWWLVPLLVRGFRGELKFEDLTELRDSDRSIATVPSFEELLKERRRKKNTFKVTSIILLWYILKINKGILIFAACLRLIHCIVLFINPTILIWLLDFLTNEKRPGMEWKGYILSVLLFVFGVLQSGLMHLQFKYCFILAMRSRTILTSAIYRKAMRFSNASRRAATVGQIVNLMSVDTQKIHDTIVYINDIWAAPVNTILCTVALWSVVGPQCMAGVCLVLLLVPINLYVLTGIFLRMQISQMTNKDSRIRMINQILAGIKVLKMYAWESSFGEYVRQIRQRELNCVKNQLYITASMGVTWFSAPYLVSLAIFAAFVMSGNILTPTAAFVTQTLIGILNLSMSALPVILGFMVQCNISLRRIAKALGEDELEGEIVEHDENMPEVIKIENATMSWGEDADAEGPEGGDKVAGTANGAVKGTANGVVKQKAENYDDEVHINKAVISLRNISLKVMPGQLVAVVGPVGSGKSTLVNTILGELTKMSGAIKIRGRLAYAPQQAWLMNATLKNNIVFAKPFDQKKYDKILEACALLPDLKVLPAGDKTEIGEKGINLSGGQKQRISLARAVYQDEDVYLLDDPLSAVDAHVGKHLFEKVIGPKGVLHGKTRVLVTHGVTYLPYVDQIISMNHGEIAEMGSYEELMEKDGHFAEFVRTYLQEKEEEEELSENEKEILQKQMSRTSSTAGSMRERSPSKRSAGGTLRRRKKKESESEKKEEKKDDAALITEEVAEQGGIKAAVLWTYIKHGGLLFLGGTILFEAVYLTAQVLVSIWLSEWTGDMNLDRRDERLGVYGGIGFFFVFGILLLSLSIYTGAVRAAYSLHALILDRIMKAPMSFFDTTPLGRIINRFSTDMDKIDYIIPTFVRMWFVCLVAVLATVILISYVTPWFLVILVPLIIIYMLVQRVYIMSIRQLKRMESIRRSPIYANFDETLTGIVSVRAYRQQERFVERNDRLVDDSQIPWYLIAVAMRWLGFTAESLGALMVFFASLFAVVSRANASMAGLSVSWAMRATLSIQMLVRAASDLETHVVSVERILEYTKVESEAPYDIPEKKPPSGWPVKGIVRFENYCTRYREGLELVLKGITFTVFQGEKLGIVGRTGAGKSSITLALYRIIEPASGTIYIDDIDVSTIGLHDLRNALTVIPQDPVLFSGTLRRNLDPFNIYSDEEIWNALESAHLKSFVAGLDEGLQYECGEGGEALSVGQRQLVCLARALLRSTKILILDEATAAVDLETDDLIQHTIRTKFTHCSVITIAHRLNTILDYDRVMVLDKGLIVELDKPDTLLSDESGVFHSMAKSAGLIEKNNETTDKNNQTNERNNQTNEKNNHTKEYISIDDTDTHYNDEDSVRLYDTIDESDTVETTSL